MLTVPVARLVNYHLGVVALFNHLQSPYMISILMLVRIVKLYTYHSVKNSNIWYCHLLESHSWDEMYGICFGSK